MLLASMAASCSRDPDDARARKVTGSAAAVAGLPRHRAPGRLLVEDCCTLQLDAGIRAERLQGVDSTIYDVAGPGYMLRVVFGPYDDPGAHSGYAPVATRMVDGVKLSLFQWNDRTPKPPDGPLLWLARVGGRKVDGVSHAPWGLRISGGCAGKAACRAARELVGTIRF
ncbi:hypothetical protein [uncultured Sphingomonas sp.]|uniref:hypothetical protein n=1 Tax=uncultured Sphingomonas sp. TaxID=158754 RepID=UPI0030D8F55E